MEELLPRLTALVRLAKEYNIGLNIDAEEADRLELSLDLMEAMAFDPSLAGFDGIGFVVQAYQKRCPFVIDYLVDQGRSIKFRLSAVGQADRTDSRASMRRSLRLRGKLSLLLTSSRKLFKASLRMMPKLAAA